MELLDAAQPLYPRHKGGGGPDEWHPTSLQIHPDNLL